MFDLKKKESCVDIHTTVVSDLKNVPSTSADELLSGLIRISRAVLKGVIGRTHEYTYEESLFILREENIIDEQTYEKLKKALLRLSFLRYSATSPQNKRSHLESIRSTLIELAPTLLAKQHQECYDIYIKERDCDRDQKPSDHLSKSKRYKEDILSTEREINEQFSSHPPPTSSPPFPNTAKPKDITVNDVADKHTKPSDSSVSIPSLNVDFSVLFSTVVGYPLKRQIDLDFTKEEQEALVWDLYVKFYIIQKRAATQIVDIITKHDIDRQTVIDLLKANKDYYSRVQRYIYLRPLLEVIVQVCVHILLDSSVDAILSDLTSKGYDRQHIIYVLSHVLMEE